MMKNIKKIVVIVIGVSIYIRGLVHGYISPVWWGWMFATALLYMMMHYVVLSRRDTVHKYGWAVRLFVAVMTLAILGYTKNIWLWISVLMWHAALWSVVHSLEEILTNRRKFQFQQFFQAWGALFSIFFTLSFITAFIGRNQQFTLTCDDITRASTAVLSYTQDKFNVWVHQINDWQRSILGNMLSHSWDEIITDDAPVNDLWDSLSGYENGSFGSMIQTYKQQLIDETIANQKNVNQKVCQVFIDQIGDMYEKPGFRVSVILLMFLFISPLLRLTLYIVSWVNILIFLILKKVGVYTVQKETVEIDKIV